MLDFLKLMYLNIARVFYMYLCVYNVLWRHFSTFWGTTFEEKDRYEFEAKHLYLCHHTEYIQYVQNLCHVNVVDAMLSVCNLVMDLGVNCLLLYFLLLCPAILLYYNGKGGHEIYHWINILIILAILHATEERFYILYVWFTLL